jgi:benzoate/toluate 1,2-dioxygenase alpha subunit
MSRGAEHWLSGPDEVATALDMPGVISAGVKNEDEGLYPVQHGHWLQVMREAVAREQAEQAQRSEHHPQTPQAASTPCADA